MRKVTPRRKGGPAKAGSCLGHQVLLKATSGVDLIKVVSRCDINVKIKGLAGANSASSYVHSAAPKQPLSLVPFHLFTHITFAYEIFYINL